MSTVHFYIYDAHTYINTHSYMLYTQQKILDIPFPYIFTIKKKHKGKDTIIYSSTSQRHFME